MGIDVLHLKDVMSYVRKRGDDVRVKTYQVAKEVAEAGQEVAEQIYADFEPNYDGVDYDVHVKVQKAEKGYDLVAFGKDVLFVEFGTGKWNGDYPTAVGNNLRGKYGNGYGDKGSPTSTTHNYWYFTGDASTNGTHAIYSKKNPKEKPYSFITHGNDPAKAMYEARKAMKKKFYELKREARNGKH